MKVDQSSQYWSNLKNLWSTPPDRVCKNDYVPPPSRLVLIPHKPCFINVHSPDAVWTPYSYLCYESCMWQCVFCVCVCVNYLNSHRPQYELRLWVGEVSLDLWRHANQRRVGHNCYHAHRLKSKLNTDRQTPAVSPKLKAGHKCSVRDAFFFIEWDSSDQESMVKLDNMLSLRNFSNSISCLNSYTSQWSVVNVCAYITTGPAALVLIIFQNLYCLTWIVLLTTFVSLGDQLVYYRWDGMISDTTLLYEL